MTKTIIDEAFMVPQINFQSKFTATPIGLYARDEIIRLSEENAKMKAAIYKITGDYWGTNFDANKYLVKTEAVKEACEDHDKNGGGSDGGEKVSPMAIGINVDKQKICQLQLCLNVMANCIAEYTGHLKKCALPYMEAYYRNNMEEIKKHHQAFMPNHVKSLITFQKYVEQIMIDAERKYSEFEELVNEGNPTKNMKAALEESYDIHYNLIPELQQVKGMTDEETTQYSVGEVAKYSQANSTTASKIPIANDLD
jgi:hypothetical protein